MRDKPLSSNSNVSYRPPQAILDVFWTLSDGNDQERNDSAVKLCHIIKNTDEEEEKGLILQYCKDRLVRGLSSGRKFARVGFSVALTQLLRNEDGLKTSDILKAVKEKLKLAGLDKRSKSEIGGIFLGRAFAFSSIIQSGRLAKISNEELTAILEELQAMSQRKSYLKPVCHSTMEDLVRQISVDSFGECVWPKIRDSMKLGWDGCTLDKLSLLLACRDNFSDVVNKKFLKKHWGFPILSEENHEKLVRVILDTATQKTEMLLKKIVPSLLENDHTPVAVWQGLGEPLMKQAQGKKTDSASQRQLLGLKLAASLLSCASDSDQVEGLMLCPSLAHSVFHVITQKNDPLAVEGNSLFEQLEAKAKSLEMKVQSLLVKLWNLSGEEADSQSGRPDIIHSHNFTKLVDLMKKEEAVEFAESLIGAIKGTDELMQLSSKESTRAKQTETCIRCLQHAVCSQNISSVALQKSCLALFLRLSFFKVNKKTPSIQHCETVVNLEDGKPTMRLCKTFLYKCLDHLSTIRGTSQSKSEHVEEYISVLVYLAHYLQSLMKSDKIDPIQSWPEQLTDEWDRVYKLVNKIEKTSKGKHSVKDSAFLLLFLYLAFHMLNDFKTSSDLLQEVVVCHTKASKQKQEKKSGNDDEELPWQEVVTEVLLNLMLLQSHLGRVISCTVLRLLSSQLTTNAVQLITEVLIPKSGRGDDAGGVLVEAEDEEDGEDDDDESLIDEDIPEEESEEEDDEEENEEADSEEDQEEEEEEGMQVDEKFRASVKEALGKAAVDDDEEEEDNKDEEDLSDLSDTEMFKLDDMLAEVFRQKKKASTTKKSQEEKKKEMATFRIRVLDLVEVLVKSDRCGDFIPELLRPLLLLILKTDAKENQSILDKSKSLFKLIKSKTKGLTDSVHTDDEQSEFLQELLDLAQTVTDASHIQEVSVACHVVMKLNCVHSKNQGKKCMNLIEEMVKNVITKGKSKPKPAFCSCLIENDVAKYQFLSPVLVSYLTDPDVKLHGKMICCSMLSSLLKKTDRVDESVEEESADWMKQLATVTSDILKSVNTDDLKVMYLKELLNVACALQKRQDVLPQSPFGVEETQHLMSIRPKLNSDLRRLANKFIAIVERCKGKSQDHETNAQKKQKKGKKKKIQPTSGDEVNGNTVTDERSKSKKKSKKRKLSQSETEDKTGENSADENTNLATKQVDTGKKKKNKKRKLKETEGSEEQVPPGKKSKQ